MFMHNPLFPAFLGKATFGDLNGKVYVDFEVCNMSRLKNIACENEGILQTRIYTLYENLMINL